jgi:NAD(P)-dependent dehydrogenase (short-subunit alcohol dehydrogenase family)
MLMARFTNRIALVTGGVHGIGRAVVDRLISDGAKVAVLDITPPMTGLDPDSDETRLYVKGDVTDPKAVETALTAIESIWGPVDILVNNAGIHRTGTILDSPLETWEAVLRINLTGAFVVAQTVANSMVRHGRGVIINVGSEAGIAAFPNQVAYNVSKAGIIHLTKCIAVDLASKGIRANVVCPGTTLTPLVETVIAESDDEDETRRSLECIRPLNRLGKPEEIAAAICMLVDDEIGYATGAVFSIDGGKVIT